MSGAIGFFGGAFSFGHGFCIGLLREWCYLIELMGVLVFALILGTAVVKLWRKWR